MTTPHPQPSPAPTPVTCPGCGKAHAPHPDTGTWCTTACIQARLKEDPASGLAAPKRKQANR